MLIQIDTKNILIQLLPIASNCLFLIIFFCYECFDLPNYCLHRHHRYHHKTTIVVVVTIVTTTKPQTSIFVVNIITTDANHKTRNHHCCRHRHHRIFNMRTVTMKYEAHSLASISCSSNAADIPVRMK